MQILSFVAGMLTARLLLARSLVLVVLPPVERKPAMPSFKEVFRIQGAYATHSTAKAIQVVADWPNGDQRPIWFPQSQVDDASEVYRSGDEGEFVCSQWIAEQKGVV